MAKKFKIETNINDYKNNEDIIAYPHLEGGAPLDVRLGYVIHVFLNGIELKDRFHEKGMGEYSYSFYWVLNEVILSLIEGKKYKYSFLDGPFELIFDPIDTKEVKISFDWMEDTSYLPELEGKREQLKEISVPFDECIDELYNAVNKYIEILLDVNPRLLESHELKQLIELRNKAEDAIIKYKKKSTHTP